MLRPFARVVSQSLKPIKRLAACKRTQQLPTLLGQQCWELLRLFAHSFTCKVRSYERESTFFFFGLILNQISVHQDLNEFSRTNRG